MAPRRCCPFLLALLCLARAAAGALPTIKLGACGYFGSTSRMYQLMDYAAKVALEDGYLDDVVANRSFQVDIKAVDTQCSGASAAEMAPPLLFGTGAAPGRISSENESDPVVGISGCGCSSSTKVTATFANPFSVTVVSGAATSPELGVKSNYPYFARTISPDSSQGYGLARLVVYYGWKRVVVVYPVSAYAEAVAANFKNMVAAGDPSVAIFQEPLPDQPLQTGDDAAAYDYSLVESVAKKVASMFPQPRIFMSPGNERAMGPILRAFDEQGLVSSQTVWLLAESACSVNSLLWVADNQLAFAAASPETSVFVEGGYNWSALPERMGGMVCLLPVSQGPRYQSAAWYGFWTNLTCDRLRVAGMSAESHCEPSFFQDFQVLDTKIYYSLIFDAMTTFFVAISDLLSTGLSAADIAGDALRDAVFAAEFEGLSGRIAFDSVGDRLAPYDIMNLQGSQLGSVGQFDGASGTIAFTSALLFADGTSQVPADRPEPCGRGEEYEGAVAGCAPCAPGRYGPEEDAQCFDCAVGSFQSAAGASACEPAPKGAYVAGAGAVAAAPCLAGSFSEEVGATSCDDCAVGYAQAGEGMSHCVRCEAGTFAGKGASLCTGCPGMLTTEFPGSVDGSDCGCAAGTYAPQEGNATCEPCPAGMQCAFGSSEAGFEVPAPGASDPDGGRPTPLLSAGYYSSPTEPLSVFRCHGEDACGGGLPGACLGGRVGLVCAACPEGELLTGGQCTSCSDVNRALPVLALLGTSALAVFVYYCSNSPVKSNATVSLAASVSSGILVTSAQLLGTLRQLSLPWSGGGRSLMSGMQVFLLDPNSLRVECLLSQDAAARYSMRFLVPFVVLLNFGALFMLSKLVVLVRSSLSSFVWEPAKTVNSICTVFQVLFIALVGMVAIPFQCYTHPNGQKSLVLYPNVICGSEEHGPFVAMALVVLVVLVLPFVTLNIWATVKAFESSGSSSSMGAQERHLICFRYLFFRFRPDVFWWGAPLNVRQLMLAFAPAVAPDDPAAQAVYVVAILLTYLAATCFYWPWKSHELNVLDAVSVAILAMLTVTVSTLMPPAQSPGWQGGLAFVLTLLLVVIGTGFVAATCLLLARGGPSADFGLQALAGPSREALGGSLHRLASLLASMAPEECARLLHRMNDFDVQMTSRFISCVQAATRCEIWVSGKVQRRLCSVEHAKASVSSELSLESLRSSIRATVGSTRSGLSTLLTSGQDLSDTKDVPESVNPDPSGTEGVLASGIQDPSGTKDVLGV